MKFYTRTGDKGETSLMYGRRVYKDDERVECLGSIDELNSFIGLASAYIKDEKIKEILTAIQRELYYVGAEVADPTGKTFLLEEKHLLELERKIDEFSSHIRPLEHFVVPGGSIPACYLHICRTACRRAERSLVKLYRKEKIRELLLSYMNRLSSFFFVLALYINKQEGYQERKLGDFTPRLKERS